jgi:small subunit ribosomal protein S17
MIKKIRKEKMGIVVSNNMNKSLIVTVENKYSHSTYGKILKKTKRFMAHDHYTKCNIGDIVLISESRPLSKKKCWVVTQILSKNKTSN